MANSSHLRVLHEGTVINTRSKKQEGRVKVALNLAVERLRTEFGVSLGHERCWMLTDIVLKLQKLIPDVSFFCNSKKSYMLPDGGVLSLLDCDETSFPILIVEGKIQGTNDIRKKERKPRQSMGNAIERLGKGASKNYFG